jgi:hypothetical protein
VQTSGCFLWWESRLLLYGVAENQTIAVGDMYALSDAADQEMQH